MHPVGAVQGEVRGLCSNLAHAMSVDVPKLVHRCNGNVEALSKYVFTKLDSQVHLPPNYFEELEMSCQRVGREAVVFQPLPVNLVNRQLSHGPMRAIAAARTFSYPILFALNLMTVTCYSVPLVQYMKMGLTHAGYLGEDPGSGFWVLTRIWLRILGKFYSCFRDMFPLSRSNIPPLCNRAKC